MTEALFCFFSVGFNRIKSFSLSRIITCSSFHCFYQCLECKFVSPGLSKAWTWWCQNPKVNKRHLHLSYHVVGTTVKKPAAGDARGDWCLQSVLSRRKGGGYPVTRFCCEHVCVCVFPSLEQLCRVRSVVMIREVPCPRAHSL